MSDQTSQPLESSFNTNTAPIVDKEPSTIELPSVSTPNVDSTVTATKDMFLFSPLSTDPSLPEPTRSNVLVLESSSSLFSAKNPLSSQKTPLMPSRITTKHPLRQSTSPKKMSTKSPTDKPTTISSKISASTSLVDSDTLTTSTFSKSMSQESTISSYTTSGYYTTPTSMPTMSPTLSSSPSSLLLGTPSSTNLYSGESYQVNRGAVIGGIIGGLALVALLGAIFVFLLGREKKGGRGNKKHHSSAFKDIIANTDGIGKERRSASSPMIGAYRKDTSLHHNNILGPTSSPQQEIVIEPPMTNSHHEEHHHHYYYYDEEEGTVPVSPATTAASQRYYYDGSK